MAAIAPTLDDKYRRYADLLRRHHRLVSQAATEDELDSTEGEMTQLWDDLDPVQQRSLSGLGSDLNWLRRGGQAAPKAKPATEVAPHDLQELSRARNGGDWHSLLHYLRLASATLSPVEIAVLRATAWQALGFPELERMFSDLAAQLEPINASPAVCLPPVDIEPAHVIRRRHGHHPAN